MKYMGGMGLWALALALVVACEKPQGSTCYEAGECGEGLGCVGEGVKRCEPCAEDDACAVNGQCTAKDGMCVTASDDDCKKGYICTGKGGCTFKDGKCVVGGDADCKQSEACKNEGFCKAKGNNCIKEKEDGEEG